MIDLSEVFFPVKIGTDKALLQKAGKQSGIQLDDEFCWKLCIEEAFVPFKIE
jgi:hypothetical protein